jgi:riboflavin-specific deaminase-like protein
MASATVRRLLPDVAETSIAEQIAGLDFVAGAHDDRPYVVTNFVLTLDGHATLHGRSGPIGSDVDTEVLVGLRTRVDAVMIGAGTMRAERYGRIFTKPERREQRERDGFRGDPLVVLVSGRLDLPWDAPLFTDGGGPILIATASDEEPPATETEVIVVRHEDEVDLAALMAHLRREHGVRALLCEGGPRLHADLIEAGVVDELFVTHAPKLSGGVGPGLVAGMAERERPVEVVWLLTDDDSGELFARYRVPAG